jgi:hypothetical protein
MSGDRPPDGIRSLAFTGRGLRMADHCNLHTGTVDRSGICGFLQARIHETF